MKKQILLASFLILGAFAQIGCGQNTTTSCPAGQVLSNNVCIVANSNAYSYNQTGYGYGNSCQNGTFFTQYGCLARGSCQNNFAFYPQGNQCVPVIANTTTNPYGTGSQGCPAGQLMTYYGCLSQGSCQPGTAFSPMYNSCVPVTNNYGTNGGINGGFNGGIYFGAGYGFGNGTLYGNSQCPGGYNYTSHGCLPQANCQYPMGYFNGTCVY